MTAVIQWIVERDPADQYAPNSPVQVPRRGAILVFLPGKADINQCVDHLRGSRVGHEVYALPLHSGLSAIEQRKAFAPPPAGRTKVIFSTNVAETSVTIDDVVYVLNSGKVRD